MGLEEFSKAAIASNQPVDNQSIINGPMQLNMMNIQYVKEKFIHREQLQPDELRSMIMYSHIYIFTQSNMSRESKFLTSIMLDIEFLKVFTDILRSTHVEVAEAICINKLIYKALKELESADCKIENKYEVKLQLYTISDLFHLNYLRDLFTQNIDRRLSTRLNIAYDSSTNVYRKVLNVNHEIVYWGIEDGMLNHLTEQDIVNIYSIYFRHMTELFIGIMLDVMPREEYDQLPESNKTVYSTIDLAVLDMAEQYLTTNDLLDVLRSYSQHITYNEYGAEVRFNLTSISPDDYQRIHDCLLYLKTAEGIMIP